jgi:hypothetical protein
LVSASAAYFLQQAWAQNLANARLLHWRLLGLKRLQNLLFLSALSQHLPPFSQRPQALPQYTLISFP